MGGSGEGWMQGGGGEGCWFGGGLEGAVREDQYGYWRSFPVVCWLKRKMNAFGEWKKALYYEKVNAFLVKWLLHGEFTCF